MIGLSLVFNMKFILTLANLFYNSISDSDVLSSVLDVSFCCVFNSLFLASILASFSKIESTFLVLPDFWYHESSLFNLSWSLSVSNFFCSIEYKSCKLAPSSLSAAFLNSLTYCEKFLSAS